MADEAICAIQPAFGNKPGRDKAAGVKMLGGLLRLDALQPDGFTARDLASHARVTLGTAQAFLKPSSVAVYAEPTGPHREPGSAAGRPQKLYRLAPAGRERVLSELADLRDATDAAGTSRRASLGAVFKPLELLEAMLRDLMDPLVDFAEFRAGVAEAEIEMRGCEAELAAMHEAKSPYASDFAQRLGLAQFKLSKLKTGLRERAEGAGAASRPAGGLFEVGGDSYISDIISYESSLRALRTVIIASDSPAPPEGEMRDMMVGNIQRGAVYVFLAPFEGQSDGVRLKELLEEYRRLERQIAADPLVRRRTAARPELHQAIKICHYSPPENLQHLIFYQLLGAGSGGADGRMEVLIRQGSDVGGPFLLLRNDSLVQTLYVLVYSRVMDEIKIPKSDAEAELRTALPEPAAPPAQTAPALRMIQGGRAVGF